MRPTRPCEQLESESANRVSPGSQNYLEAKLRDIEPHRPGDGHQVRHQQFPERDLQQHQDRQGEEDGHY